MKPRMRAATFGCTVLLLVPVALNAQQAPPPAVTPGTTATGAPGTRNQKSQSDNGTRNDSATIRGRVVRADSGEPLRRVQVRAIASESYSALTDADGRYELSNLPAGSYQLTASRGGFVEMQYGQKRAFRAGRAVALAEGATFEKIDFALMPGGVIAGRILDDAGEPVIGAFVNVSRLAYTDGRRQLRSSGGDRSDDRGEFRIFDLPPADYYVYATLDSPNDASNLGLRYAATYYPGTASHTEAQQVRLKAGEELSGIVFPLVTTRTSSITGVVRNVDGTPALLAMVLARPRSGDIAPMMGMEFSGITKPDGSFAVANVAPGAYSVEARAVMDGGMISSAIDVVVSGRDISGIALQFARSGTLHGRVRFDGGRPPTDLTPERIRLFPISLDAESFGSGSAPGPPRDDWTFEMKGMTGKRLIRGGDIRGTWRIKSVQLEGTDVTDVPIDFSGGDVHGLEVVLTAQKIELSGVVMNDRGATVTDATVVAFADDPEKWGPQTRFIESARLDQNGRFTMQSLAAGTYIVVATDDMEPGEERDPGILEQLRSKGSRVTLRDGETRTIEVKVVSY
jgi:hypothetical protein